MRSSHDANVRNSRSPNCASIFSSRKTAAIFSSSTIPENNLSATFTRKSKSCFRKISRRQPRTARRNSAVYQPRDLISALKNHCTPAACSVEPPPFSAFRICVATADSETGTGKYRPRPKNERCLPMQLVQFCQHRAALQVHERRRFECLPRSFKATLDYVFVYVAAGAHVAGWKLSCLPRFG